MTSCLCTGRITFYTPHYFAKMMKSLFCYAFFMAISMALFGQSSALAKEKAPNVIIIFPDQYRQYSLGFWSEGDNARHIQGKPDPAITPNLDKLAKGGIVFSRAVSNLPLCSPYRGMLLTGKYPAANGVTANCHKNRSVGVKVDGKAIANVYADAGYETALFGKCHWHRTEPVFDENGTYQASTEAPGGHYINAYDTYVPPGAPRLGFQYFFQTLKDSHFDPLCYSSDPKVTEGAKDGELYHPRRFNAALESETLINYLDNTHQQRDTNKPFFITWALNPPHNPWTEKSTDMRFFPQYTEDGEINIDALLLRDNADKDKGAYAPYYFANVSAVDHYIGQVLDKLEELGMADNTIIVFTSDHGEMLGSHNRSGKLVPYTEAYNIPFIIKWGDRLQHRIEDLMLSVPDIMPTLLALSGLKKRIPTSVQGSNYAPILQGRKKSKAPKEVLYMDYLSRGLYTGDHTFVVQSGDQGKFKEAYYYDNKKDPYQLHQIKGDEMDKKLVKRFKKKLARHLKAIEDTWAQDKICSDYLRY